MVRRLHMVLTGRVQGVGLRRTAQTTAQGLGMTGWVRNEPDGSVTMELQGSDAQIAAFFGGLTAACARRPIDYVIVEKEDVRPEPGEEGFALALPAD